MVETTDYGSHCDPPLVYVTAIPPSTEEDTTTTTYSDEDAYPPFPADDNNTDHPNNKQEPVSTNTYNPTDNVTVPLLVSTSDTDSIHPDEGDGHTADDDDDDNDEEEDPVQKKIRRRRRRKRRMVVGGVTGLIVGSIVVCGPIGAVLGAVAGVWLTRVVSKRRERAKVDRCAARKVHNMLLGAKNCQSYHSDPKPSD